MPFDNLAPKVERLVRSLLQSTDDDLVEWSTTADDDAYRLTSKTANIQIQRSEIFDPEGESDLRRTLLVFNRQGRLVEEYTPRHGGEIDIFDRLFQAARRSACKTDAILDQLLEEIEQGSD